jgi:hypothetical protein
VFWKKKEPCFHEWKLSDYHSGVDASFEVFYKYEITCVKCNKSRNVDKYDFDKMKDLGLLK